ncbi:hypothetical protein X976_3046 [Burkholderia pseudomallei MSHR7500]|nr:hypothetical protein X976_3046 [Burkholderia pseudomallei MSHR7500]
MHQENNIAWLKHRICSIAPGRGTTIVSRYCDSVGSVRRQLQEICAGHPIVSIQTDPIILISLLGSGKKEHYQQDHAPEYGDYD